MSNMLHDIATLRKQQLVDAASVQLLSRQLQQCQTAVSIMHAQSRSDAVGSFTNFGTPDFRVSENLRHTKYGTSVSLLNFSQHLDITSFNKHCYMHKTCNLFDSSVNPHLIQSDNLSVRPVIDKLSQ